MVHLDDGGLESSISAMLCWISIKGLITHHDILLDRNLWLINYWKMQNPLSCRWLRLIGVFLFLTSYRKWKKLNGRKHPLFCAGGISFLAVAYIRAANPRSWGQGGTICKDGDQYPWWTFQLLVARLVYENHASI